MPLTLGIDTGGTYTDAVLFDTHDGVLASAKALTTKDDLAIGIAEATDRIIGEHASEIVLVSVSTTLATNAIVEGRGSRAALILVGHSDEDRFRPDLSQALGSDPLLCLAGGHDAFGEERAPLELDRLVREIGDVGNQVSAFAVSAHFAVRNPEHEIAVRDLLRSQTGLPVSCAHQLSSELDAPRRALTALLNARLVPLIQNLILAVKDLMKSRGILAPIMAVKGDGSLIDVDTALETPVETILSGPAASVVGAHHLSGKNDAFVSDMGGTTTDIAVVRDGRPAIDRRGARVGGYRTMVSAVSAHTFGLGGDSEVRLNDRGRIEIGPRRAVPLSLLVSRNPGLFDVLTSQAARSWPSDLDGIFVMRQHDSGQVPPGLTRPQHRLWNQLADGPVPLESLYRDYSPKLPLEALSDRDLVISSRFTPSDAAHILGVQSTWHREAAEIGARLWVRWWAMSGHPAPEEPEEFARLVFDATISRSTEVILATAMQEEHRLPLPDGKSATALLGSAIEGRKGELFNIAIELSIPIVGVGAPAGSYYDAVGKRLNTETLVPQHAEVCNAVGAVAGGIVQYADALITAPQSGLFRCHLPTGVKDFVDLDEAVSHTRSVIEHQARSAAVRIGATEIMLSFERHDEIVHMKDGSEIFIECRVAATASGRPAISRG